MRELICVLRTSISAMRKQTTVAPVREFGCCTASNLQALRSDLVFWILLQILLENEPVDSVL